MHQSECSDKVKDFIYSLDYHDDIAYEIGDASISTHDNGDYSVPDAFEDGIGFALNRKHLIFYVKYDKYLHEKQYLSRKAAETNKEIGKMADDIVDDEEDVVGYGSGRGHSHIIYWDAIDEDDVIRQIKNGYDNMKAYNARFKG